eukprot:TRINITY_DN19516_c0_g1_i1.p1 TRINITY_DN19516_c0_g1~~TRINITY_DN19516_c0_g1_i1.p1  ORF type:complete len:382 (-),score=51.12 TRINITY_DN19516_c0_g1_i1:88-1233(-)
MARHFFHVFSLLVFAMWLVTTVRFEEELHVPGRSRSSSSLSDGSESGGDDGDSSYGDSDSESDSESEDCGSHPLLASCKQFMLDTLGLNEPPPVPRPPKPSEEDLDNVRGGLTKCSSDELPDKIVAALGTVNAVFTRKLLNNESHDYRGSYPFYLNEQNKFEIRRPVEGSVPSTVIQRVFQGSTLSVRTFNLSPIANRLFHLLESKYGKPKEFFYVVTAEDVNSRDQLLQSIAKRGFSYANGVKKDKAGVYLVEKKNDAIEIAGRKTGDLGEVAVVTAQVFGDDMIHAKSAQQKPRLFNLVHTDEAVAALEPVVIFPKEFTDICRVRIPHFHAAACKRGSAQGSSGEVHAAPRSMRRSQSSGNSEKNLKRSRSKPRKNLKP